mmetsp:Transcript_59549/g.168782  ORF Transcript_59549/g.168782 Transcript_59549/m.168782 type:complete len:107 (+) Transcript_59549:81-401(+)
MPSPKRESIQGSRGKVPTGAAQGTEGRRSHDQVADFRRQTGRFHAKLGQVVNHATRTESLSKRQPATPAFDNMLVSTSALALVFGTVYASHVYSSVALSGKEIAMA